VWPVAFIRIFRHPPLANFRHTHTHTYTYTQYSSSLSLLSSVTSQASIDLFQPRPVLSSKVFQDLFAHSVYNSALFLPSYCFSFLLQVVANLICTSLVSSRTGYALSSSGSSSFLLWSNMCKPPAVILKNFISIDLNAFYPLSKGPNFAPV